MEYQAVPTDPLKATLTEHLPLGTMELPTMAALEETLEETPAPESHMAQDLDQEAAVEPEVEL